MKSFKLIKIMLTVSAICVFASGLFAQKMALKGTVGYPKGSPVSGAEVSVYDAAKNTLLNKRTTDAQGGFTCDSVFKGGQRIYVKVVANGFAKFSHPYTIRSGNTGWIVLKPLTIADTDRSNTKKSSTKKTATTAMVEKGYHIKGVVRANWKDNLDSVAVFFTYNGQDAPIDICFTDRWGAYESNKRFKKGDKIVVAARKKDYAESARTVDFKEARDYVEDFVLNTQTTIAGNVWDQKTSSPLKDVQISYQIKGGVINYAIPTNENGDFDFEVKSFAPNDKITVWAKKEGYVSDERTVALPVTIGNLKFDLLNLSIRGVNVEIRTFKKNSKPLGGVKINYVDDSIRNIIMPFSGVQALNIKKAPGDSVHFYFWKPGYKMTTYKLLLGKESPIIDIKMEKRCPCWLYTSLGLAALSGTSYGLFSAAYNDYENLKNLDRQKDYKKSTTWLRATTISGGLAVVALASWGVCRTQGSKHIDKEADKRQRTGFVPLFQSDTSQGMQIGLAYQF